MTKGYWYIGSPYSKYPGGLVEAFKRVCRVTGRFAQAGVPAYSPIAHTHPIAAEGALDPHDHSIWLPFDGPLMEAARGLVVVMMDGWQDSIGLQFEIDHFKRAGKPVMFIDEGDDVAFLG